MAGYLLNVVLISILLPLRGYTMTIEGQEKDDFWNLLGGKKEYSSSARLAVSHLWILPITVTSALISRIR